MRCVALPCRAARCLASSSVRVNVCQRITCTYAACRGILRHTVGIYYSENYINGCGGSGDSLKYRVECNIAYALGAYNYTQHAVRRRTAPQHAPRIRCESTLRHTNCHQWRSVLDVRQKSCWPITLPANNHIGWSPAVV